MLLDTTISITKIDNDYNKTLLYPNIRANLQARLYNIKDALSNIAEDESNNKYYILIDKRYTKVRMWDLIDYIDDFWIEKTLKITSFWMEKFISKPKFIEIKAEDYINNG